MARKKIIMTERKANGTMELY
uniref:Uncharacterized protein n=1 Tax=Rhizophora mucronata TaxID=61149 RepID=A0A2P2IJS5_RHIMU